ncbi:tripartite tricarboxylate transporter permease [Roseococcus sp. SYP-B2431]|uniref:tripartite tricarboxylate transporter permease n=1 Tax=Roseococcus sp. SYP-B2431 TaxID=2496640 RepID=UPI00103CA3FA|nr:tripartite tricarboxylate transporter permease [Roseococcus sp. SYP-B2431]TCH98217.1 tripartite tricarboxylate transporter permease [Roseococcus sp. SYP-B2431]
MDLLSNLSLGFATALSLQNLLYAFTGCLLGTLIGVLPGLGPVATMSMLLPATFALPPTSALIMLAGIYYGAQYGGSTTAILVKLPGESSSVVTVLDGHEMARRGRAGIALTTAAVGSFFAGTVGTLVIAAFAVPLASVALKFGPPEYFSLMVVGLIGSVVLASGSVLKAIAMVVLGLALGLVGTDTQSGVERFTFEADELVDGLNFVAITMGVFGLAEIIANLEKQGPVASEVTRVSTLFPTRQDWRRMCPAILRGTGIGSTLGIFPGGGPVISSLTSYLVERRVSKNPGEFGKGAIEGVAGPESANNAAAQISFIPMLTLGIPSNIVMAMMAGAMMMHSIQPSPQVMTRNPDLFWGLIASMWIGNVMLLVLNLPLVGIWVKFLTIPYRFLYPAIIVFCCVGVFSVNNMVFDIYQAAFWGVVGYAFLKLRLEPAPMLLGLVLGPMMEENFRRALVLSRGDFHIFVSTPLACVFLGLAVLLLIVLASPALRKKREKAFHEED